MWIDHPSGLILEPVALRGKMDVIRLRLECEMKVAQYIILQYCNGPK